MQIIVESGSARTACMKALDAIEKADFTAAELHLKEADEDIYKAHNAHTTVLQEAMRLEQNGAGHAEYSILFAHAQDTLMTISTELNIAGKLLQIFRAYEGRIAQLEEKIGKEVEICSKSF